MFIHCSTGIWNGLFYNIDPTLVHILLCVAEGIGKKPEAPESLQENNNGLMKVD